MADTKKSRVREGSAEAHGAIWDGKGTNFTLFSANATKVEVCLFDSAGGTETERIALPEYTDLVLWLHFRCASKLGVRLSRPRTLRAEFGPPI